MATTFLMVPEDRCEMRLVKLTEEDLLKGYSEDSVESDR